MFNPKPSFISDVDIFKSVNALKGFKKTENKSLVVKNISVPTVVKSVKLQDENAEIKDDYIKILNKYKGSDILWIV